MPTIRCAILFLTISTCCSGIVHAQDANSFRHLTDADGLGGNSVISLMTDRYGKVWIGTANGLDRHDGARITTYRHVTSNENTIPDPRVDAIYESDDGRIWIGTQNGFARYRPETDDFERIDLQKEGRVVIHDIDQIDNETLYLSTWAHGLIGYSLLSGEAFDVLDIPDPLLHQSAIRSLSHGDAGRTWVSTYWTLRLLDKESASLYRPDWPEQPSTHLDSTVVFRMLERRGILWLATTRGLHAVNVETGDMTRYPLGPDDEDWSYVRTLFVDSQNGFWVGSHGGLAKYQPDTDSFTAFRHHPDVQATIAPGAVHAISEDHSGNLWVGSDEMGVSIADLYARPIRRIEQSRFPESEFPDGHVWVATTDGEGKLWLGHEGGFGYWSDEEDRFHEASPPGFPVSTVSALSPALPLGLWVGTQGNGLCLFISAGNTCTFLDQQFSTIYDVLQVSENELWVGEFGGLVRINLRDGSRQIYEHDPDDPTTLGNGLVTSINIDARGRIWITTDAGLDRFDPVSNSFVRVINDVSLLSMEELDDGTFWVVGQDVHRFDPRDEQLESVGLLEYDWVSGTAKSGVLDQKKRLWVNLTNTVVSFTPDGVLDQRFTNLGGRRSFTFPVSAHHLRPDGSIVMGLQDGIYLFHPDLIKQNPFEPAPLVVGALLDGEWHQVDDQIPLEIPPQTSVVTFQLASPHFGTASTRYEILMEGFESEWRETTGAEVTFTKLTPDDYTLRVRATTSNGLTGELATPVRIVVTPPWWFRSWFFVVMTLSGAAIFVALFKWRVMDITKQNQRLDDLVKQRTIQLAAQTEELKEVNEMKSRFFSNVSHELRTPLTLIGGYLEDLQASDIESQGPKNQQRLARAHGLTERLDGLVTQLLELARADGNRLKLNAQPGDLVPFTQRIVAHFSVAANRKFIDLSFETDTSHLWVDFDPLKMDQIISNLINNAIKFTPRNGSVWVTLTIEDGQAALWVADTGPGISTHDQKKIFERFFQVENEMTRHHDGLGIGLALTNDLVQLHQGSITVSSEPGEGTVFKLKFPITVAGDGAAPDSESPEPERKKTPTFIATDLTDVGPRPKLLLVEDNAELRRQLHDVLQDQFEIVEAANGEEGWKVMSRQSPDIVLSDVMMPGMSGLELLREIRATERFQNLPVVLLTARTDEEAQVEGFEAAADAYIGKPFNRRVLRAQLSNLMRREREWSDVESSADISLTSEQIKFLELVREYIEAHISSSDLTVAELAEVTNTGERTFQRWIKEITGGSGAAFVRSLRLEHSKKLLEQGAVRSVTHAAQESGFGNVSHFSKLFEETFGINPKRYLE